MRMMRHSRRVKCGSMESTPTKCPSSPDENRLPEDETAADPNPALSQSHYNSCANLTLHSHVELHKMHPNGTAHVI